MGTHGQQVQAMALAKGKPSLPGQAPSTMSRCRAVQATCVKLSARMTAVRGSSPAVRGTPDTFLGAIGPPSPCQMFESTLKIKPIVHKSRRLPWGALHNSHKAICNPKLEMQWLLNRGVLVSRSREVLLTTHLPERVIALPAIRMMAPSDRPSSHDMTSSLNAVGLVFLKLWGAVIYFVEKHIFREHNPYLNYVRQRQMAYFTEVI